MERFKALKTAVRIIDLLAQLPGEHCLPVHCNSAEEAALLVSFIRGTDETGRFQSTGNGRFLGFEASGDAVYSGTEIVYIRSVAVRRLCGHCETYNDKHDVVCQVCDKPL